MTKNGFFVVVERVENGYLVEFDKTSYIAKSTIDVADLVNNLVDKWCMDFLAVNSNG